MTAGTTSPTSSRPPSASATQRHPATQQPPGAEALVEDVAAQPGDRHPEREAGERHRGRGGARAGVLAQVDAAPVGDAALGHHHEEAEPADQQHGARRQRESGADLGVGRCAPQPGRDPERRQPERDADDEALEPRVDSGRAGDDDQARGGEPAEAPAAVERGHDRLRERALDGDAVRVHRDVHRTVRRAEDEQDRGEHVRVGRQQRQRQHEAEDERGRPRHGRARAPVENLPGERHRDEPAGGHAEQAEPERRLGDPELVLEPGDVRDPGPDHRAVHEEDGEGGQAGRHAATLFAATFTPAARR